MSFETHGQPQKQHRALVRWSSRSCWLRPSWPLGIHFKKYRISWPLETTMVWCCSLQRQMSLRTGVFGGERLLSACRKMRSHHIARPANSPLVSWPNPANSAKDGSGSGSGRVSAGFGFGF